MDQAGMASVLPGYPYFRTYNLGDGTTYLLCLEGTQAGDSGEALL
jgi:hypothetical protein